MSFLSKLKNVLASPSIVEKAADSAIKGLDAAWHTPEEKAEHNKERVEQALKFVELTKGASPARRKIANIVMLMWAFAGLNVIVLINIAAVVEDPTNINTAIKSIIEFSIDYIAKPTGLVLAFYFLKNIIPGK